jgi:hypothetical protein
MSTISTRVQEQIMGIVRPLADELRSVESEIVVWETELAELKKARTQLRGVIKGIAPEMLPDEPEKPKKKKEWQPKAESALALLDFLHAHRDELNGDGFHAAGLTAQYPDQLPIAYSTVHKVLAQLHEQGTIRLDRTGTGGAKFYKLVGA